MKFRGLSARATVRRSVHLEAEYLVGVFRSEAVFAVVQVLIHLDLEQAAAERIDVDAARVRDRLALMRSHDFTLAVLHVKAVKLELVGRDLVGLKDERRSRQRSPGGGAGSGDDIGDILLTLFLFGFGHLGGQIDETKRDWEEVKKDSSVPTAAGDWEDTEPDDSTGEDPTGFDDPESLELDEEDLGDDEFPEEEEEEDY